MSRRGDQARTFLRTHGLGLAGAAGLVVLGVVAFRLAAGTRAVPEQRRQLQFTIVNVQTAPPRPPPPPPEPKPVVQPKVEDQPQTTRVALKNTDFTPPDPTRPAPGPSGGGRLSLAAEGEGPGDAFNLVGNPGGRGILTGGGLGDGSGDELGEGGGGGSARFGWYYARIATEIEAAFRKQKVLAGASARVELRVWADADGRILRVQLVKSTGDPAVDDAIQSVVGLKLREPPPPDIPMPMIARLTARRVR